MSSCLWKSSFVGIIYLYLSFCSSMILLMEYQLKKEQVLKSVEYTNLLSFNLVENKLERNFKSIVQALLLNQQNTEQLQARTHELQQKINNDNRKDVVAVQQLIKQLQQRVANLEQQGLSALPTRQQQSVKENNHQSEKILKNEVKERFNSTVSPLPAPVVYKDYDSKIEEIGQDIQALKDKLPNIQLMENQIDSMKRQFTALRAEIITFSKSHKSLKRQSIQNHVSTPSLHNVATSVHNLANGTNNNIPAESNNNITNGDVPNNLGNGTSGTSHSLRRDNFKRASVLSHSNSSAVLLNDLTNKENNNAGRIKEEGDTKEVEGNRMEGEVQKDLEGLHVEVNTLNLCYEELKALVQDLRKRDLKHHSQINDLQLKQKKGMDQTRKGFEEIEKQLKVLQVEMINTPSSKEDTEKKSPQKRSPKAERTKSPGNISRDENTINWKDQLNDRISKLQSSLQNFVTETQFNRFKTQTRDKTDQLEKKNQKLVQQFEEETKKIYDMLINKDLEITRIDEQIVTTQEVIKQNNAQADRKHNIAMARIEELKKNLQNLREDVEFYQSMNSENKQKKTTESEKGTEKQGQEVQRVADSKALDELKRYFNNKLHDQRAYLVGLVRDLEKKMNSSNNLSQDIANLWDKISEFNMFLGRKADGEDVKKNLIFLEKKIGRLSAQLMKPEDNTEDARAAKTNWFCLSCDKNLLGYQGKIGRHVVWDQIPLKGLTKATVDKKSLPSLQKSK